MVDKALYVAASGANDAMKELGVITNNLANANTSGFRADYEVMKQHQVGNDPNATRVYSVGSSTYSSFTQGPIANTGRDLDVALAGNGFIAVQSKTGAEGYTRAGDLQIKNGVLTTGNGNVVLSPTGVIQVPLDAERISIGNDGTVNAKLKGQTDMVPLSRIKLVNPPASQLQKGADGLFYLPQGDAAKQDDSIRLTPGALEGSNVNPVETLTSLIEISRQFEMRTNLLKTVQENATKANQLLNVQG